MQKTKQLLWVGLLTAVLTVLVACGGNDENPEAASDAPNPAASFCVALGNQMEASLNIPTAVAENIPFADFVTGEQVDSCQVLAVDNEVAFGSLSEATTALEQIFTSQAWQVDPSYGAAGPTGQITGYRSDGLLCVLRVEWEPAPGVDCPTDQPISACVLTPEQKMYTAVVNCR